MEMDVSFRETSQGFEVSLETNTISFEASFRENSQGFQSDLTENDVMFCSIFGEAIVCGTTAENLDEVLSEQENLISELQAILAEKAAGVAGDPSLPEGYLRSSYIQFNGAQIVDTGVVCNQDSKIKVLYTRESDASVYLYGVASSGNTASVTAYLGGYWRFGSKASTRTVTVSEELIHTAIQDKTGVDSIASKGTYSGVTAFETIGSLVIGTSRNTSGAIGSAQFVGKIFSFEIWQESEKLLHLIPVVGLDGVYRFYDKVSGQFFDSISDTSLDGGNL